MISLILLKLFTFSQILQGVPKLLHATVYIYNLTLQTGLINLYRAFSFSSFDRYFAKAMAQNKTLKTLYVTMRSINIIWVYYEILAGQIRLRRAATV